MIKTVCGLNTTKYYCYKTLAAICYAAPLAVLFALNFEEYVSSPGAGISFFGYILLAFVLFGAKGKILACAQKNTMLTVCIVVFITALIMQYLATQLLLISGAGLLGCVISIPFDKTADEFGKERGKPNIAHKEGWRRAFGFPPKEDDSNE